MGRRQSHALVNTGPSHNANFKDAKHISTNPPTRPDGPASFSGMPPAAPAEGGEGDPEELGRPQDPARHPRLGTISPGNWGRQRHDTADAGSEDEEEDPTESSARQRHERGHPGQNAVMDNIKSSLIYLAIPFRIFQLNIYLFHTLTTSFLFLRRVPLFSLIGSNMCALQSFHHNLDQLDQLHLNWTRFKVWTNFSLVRLQIGWSVIFQDSVIWGRLS